MKKVWKGAAAAISAAAIAATGFIGVNAANAATITLGTETNAGGVFDVAGRTFAVYQIMTGTVADDNTITDAQWGTNAKQYSNAEDANNAVTQEQITALKELLEGKTTDAAKGKALYDAYVNTGSTAVATLDKDNLSAADLAAGWYVVVETTGNMPADTSKALYMFSALSADETLTLKPKTTPGPDFIKKVQENTKPVGAIDDDRVDTTNKWNDIADYNIGDNVPFKLTATLPSDYADYSEYKLVFTDTRGTGFDEPEDIVVKAGTHTLTANTHYTTSTSGQVMTVTLENIKAEAFKDFGIVAGTNITVDYKMRLNDSAVIGGNGNPNTAQLEYSNNPNSNGTGTSHEEYTKTFTYKIDGTKKQAGTENTLAGAKFVLQRKSDGKFQATTADGKTEWITIDGVTDSSTSAAVAEAVKDTDVKVSTSNADGEFGFTGLDYGEYNLWEIEAPANFTLPTTPFAVNVTSVTNNMQNLGAINTADGLTSVGAVINGTTINGSTTNGVIDFDIENSSTSALPETGGMGTTMLYVAGGAIVLIAGIGMAVALRRRQA
ncbi:isopeptide-forming domain-containing fimbrial protein [Bifidobacterium pseudolongum]|uniref:isopeptide-forming domain-containing fimbrial protein n=1 Tax=Bifidobacterium pseudolongum TaxID=1694 RepID=UPI00101F1333|nr:isopeptide-forming domain-containing fimbrial protein [Bifidobacterium pseudolongum]RYQ43175.1 Gram-positive pilin backbone subunit 2, Cna-B-like domain-containing protein [Bifidobacterium pseudolongum subsp. globosum]